MLVKPSAGPSARRFHLRQSTAADHARIDGLVGDFGSLNRYAAYLRGAQAFRGPVERAISACDWPLEEQGWRPLSIAAALDLDLRDINHGLRDEELASSQPDAFPLDLRARETMLGTLYVLEGSGLGARVLARRAQALGFHEHKGARHLAMQAGATDSWRGYLDLLDSAADLNMNDVSQAARATFAFAGRCFEGSIRE